MRLNRGDWVELDPDGYLVKCDRSTDALGWVTGPAEEYGDSAYWVGLDPYSDLQGAWSVRPCEPVGNFEWIPADQMVSAVSSSRIPYHGVTRNVGA